MVFNLDRRQSELDRLVGFEHSFDIKKRPLVIHGVRAYATYIIGYTDNVLMERIFDALQRLETDLENEGMQALLERSLSFAAAETMDRLEKAAEEVLRGSTVLLAENCESILVMDARLFSVRGLQEPEKNRTLRGPHIGLNESLISNTVQIRRYLRTPDLATEQFVVGKTVKNEVVLAFIQGKADEKLLSRIREKLSSCPLPALTMTQETLATYLFPSKKLSFFNPFPRVRYTERPDVIAASLVEGKIALICDNSPSVMLLPECIFDFFEEADDYYFPPMTASYLRIVRGLVFFASVFLIPVWLLVVQHANQVPDTFSFILTEDGYSVPLFLQFLIIELALDGLKMASLNTPSTLSNSFSVIGGLLLGEFAVKSKWFVPQTILYSAFTGIANFVPTNYELGYSFKFIRISLILLVEFLGVKGFVLGCLAWILVLISTRSVAGKGYLFPLFPFDKKAFAKLFIRHTKGKETEQI